LIHEGEKETLPWERSETKGEGPARREEVSEVNQQLHHGETVGEVVLMETGKLLPCKLNPRKDFRGIERLAESMKRNNVVEPLIVRLLPEGAEVVCGERRRRAALLAQIPKVPVIIRDYNDRQVVELSLIEDIESEELTDLEKGQACAQLKANYKEKYPNDEALAKRFNVSTPTVQRWIQAATGISKDLQKLIATTKIKRGACPPKGTITTDTALAISRMIKEPERQLALGKAIGELCLPQKKARQVIKEAKAFPGRSIPEIVKKCLQTAPRVHFSVKDADLIKTGEMTQTIRTERADTINVGSRIEAFTKLADLQVLDKKRKRLADFTEEDAKAQGYTLDQFKLHWVQDHGVWNPNEKVEIIKFKVEKLVPRKWKNTSLDALLAQMNLTQADAEEWGEKNYPQYLSNEALVTRLFLVSKGVRFSLPLQRKELRPINQLVVGEPADIIAVVEQELSTRTYIGCPNDSKRIPNAIEGRETVCPKCGQIVKPKILEWALFLLGDASDETIACFPPSITRPKEGMTIKAEGATGNEENEEFLVHNWSPIETEKEGQIEQPQTPSSQSSVPTEAPMQAPQRLVAAPQEAQKEPSEEKPR
jgi:ParB family chromosome partitioning protein